MIYRMSNGVRKSTISIVQIALAAATLSAAKFALMWLPNIEVVTLLCAVYGFTLGWKGIAASGVFAAIETLIWGFGSWVITYFIHWPLVAFSFCILSRFIKPSRIIPTVAAFVLTVEFSVLSALVDVGLTTGYFYNFGERFVIYFLRGTWFYVAQIACNLVLFPLLFKPLTALIARFTKKQDVKINPTEK